MDDNMGEHKSVSISQDRALSRINPEFRNFNTHVF